MSPQFGYWNFLGQTAGAAYLEEVTKRLRTFGPDDVRRASGPGFEIVHSSFYTTKESYLEAQPYATASGAFVTWDGRLDNRVELARALRGKISPGSPDGAIVAAAYEQWGIASLSKLIGDWAMSVWHPRTLELYLAKDFVGAVPLYYRLDSSNVTWSSSLEALVLETDHLSLSEEYVAAWLTHFPAPHLTPYREIHAVPPAGSVRIANAAASASTYWTFDRVSRIRYQHDEEYEEHFRQVFAESVRRRLRSSHPVVAELSGGMDSSSIVCVADTLISSGVADIPRLDTISHFDPSEPDWDEHRYFSIVEQKRGRIGCHIDIGRKTALLPVYRREDFAAVPLALARSPEVTERRIETFRGQGNRVILSGIGGDELLGGVATPIPELADLLVALRFGRFLRQTAAWSLALRNQILSLAFQTAKAFLPVGNFALENYRKPPEWIVPRFAKRNRCALFAYQRNFRIFGPSPSSQSNLDALGSLQRQLASVALSSPPFEKRYPYLDRDLWTFVWGIPCEQLLRPRQRRSLMRRALAGIVPPEIIGRPNKAFVVRGPTLALAKNWPTLEELTRNMTSAALGIVDPKIFRQALEQARTGRPVSIVAIYRTLAIECWLRHAVMRTRSDCLFQSWPVSSAVLHAYRMPPAGVSSHV